MCIIKFSTQQHKGIYDTTNNLKIIISVRGGGTYFFCSVYNSTRLCCGNISINRSIKIVILTTSPLCNKCIRFAILLGFSISTDTVIFPLSELWLGELDAFCVVLYCSTLSSISKTCSTFLPWNVWTNDENEFWIISRQKITISFSLMFTKTNFVCLYNTKRWNNNSLRQITVKIRITIHRFVLFWFFSLSYWQS